MKLKILPLKDRRTPDISITPTKSGKYIVHDEKSGGETMPVSKETLREYANLSDYQIRKIKGTTNFVWEKGGR